jgi:hypothetical protein
MQEFAQLPQCFCSASQNLARFLALDAQNPGTGAKRFPELIFRFALQLWML